MSGLGGMIMQGMMFGGGSAIAHRAIDSVAGPRQVEHVHTGADGGEGDVDSSDNFNSSSSSQQNNNPCKDEIASFNQCMVDNNNNIGQCSFYMEVLG